MALSTGSYYYFFVTVYPRKGQQLLTASSSFGIHTLIFRGFISHPHSWSRAIYISRTSLLMCVSGIHALAISVYNLSFIVVTWQQERPVSILFINTVLNWKSFFFFY